MKSEDFKKLHDVIAASYGPQPKVVSVTVSLDEARALVKEMLGSDYLSPVFYEKQRLFAQYPKLVTVAVVESGFTVHGIKVLIGD